MVFNMREKKKDKRESIEVQTDLCMVDIDNINKKIIKLNNNVVCEQGRINLVWEQLSQSCKQDNNGEHLSSDRNNELVENEEVTGPLQGKVKKLEKRMKVFFEENLDQSRTHAREIKGLYKELGKQQKSQDELKTEIKETKSELKVERERTIKLESKMESMMARSEKEKEEMHRKINDIHQTVANALPMSVMQAEIESSRRMQLELEARMKRYDDALINQSKETCRIRGQLQMVGEMRKKIENVEIKTERLEADTCHMRGKLERINLRTEQLGDYTTEIRKQINNHRTPNTPQSHLQGNDRVEMYRKSRERQGMGESSYELLNKRSRFLKQNSQLSTMVMTEHTTKCGIQVCISVTIFFINRVISVHFQLKEQNKLCASKINYRLVLISLCHFQTLGIDV